MTDAPNYSIVLLYSQESELNEIKELLKHLSKYTFKHFIDHEEAMGYILNNSDELGLVLISLNLESISGFDFRKQMISTNLAEIPTVIFSQNVEIPKNNMSLELRLAGQFKIPAESETLADKCLELMGERILAIEEEHDLRGSFVEETGPLIEELEELIMGLEAHPDNADTFNTFFRILHTVKGTAACVGIRTISNYTHKFEDLIGRMRKENIPANTGIIEVFLRGLDEIKKMCDLVKNKKKLPVNITEKVKMFDIPGSILYGAKTEMGEVAEAVTAEKNRDDEKIHVSTSLLDSFLFESGELTVLRNMLLRSYNKLEQRLPQDKDLEILGDTLEEFHKVSSSIQHQMTELRKISVSSVVRPFRRVIRDVCTVSGKKVKFETTGEDLKVDNNLARVMSQSLVHLIRNAIDHGVETIDERKEKGKPLEGNLTLSIIEERENIKIEIKDDGKGIDRKVIAAKAVEKGIHDAKAVSEMSDQQIFSLIFHSGFSTAKVITEISGRGVGMDMVKSTVENFGGKILIDSVLDKGTTFTLYLPIPRSVLILNSLMVVVGKTKFAIPSNFIVEVLLKKNEKSEKNIESIEGANFIRHQGDLISLINLGEVLKISDDKIAPIEDLSIIVLNIEGIKFALIVDEIGDIEEIVSKKVAPHIQNLSWFMGATLIGDNEVGAIIDIKGLAQSCNLKMKEEDTLGPETEEVVVEEENEFMLFSFSEGQKLGIPLEIVNRLEEIKAKNIEFSGNVALVRYRGNVLPIVHLEHFLNFSDQSIENYIKEKENLHVIVISREEKFFGLLVNNIEDIGKSIGAIDEEIGDRDGIQGTVFIENKTISLIDCNYVIDHFKDLIEFKKVTNQKDAA